MRYSDLCVVCTRNPGSACEWQSRHCCGFDRQRDKILSFEMVNILFATCSRDRRELHVQCLEVIAQTFGTYVRLQSLLEQRILSRHTHGTTTRMTVMTKAWRGTERGVITSSGHMPST